LNEKYYHGLPILTDYCDTYTVTSGSYVIFYVKNGIMATAIRLRSKYARTAVGIRGVGVYRGHAIIKFSGMSSRPFPPLTLGFGSKIR